MHKTVSSVFVEPELHKTIIHIKEKYLFSQCSCMLQASEHLIVRHTADDIIRHLIRFFIYLLETRHNVPSDGANQSCDVIHEAFRKSVLPG